MHTPASVHDGSWVAIEARRAATLDAAYRTHPERFHLSPAPPDARPGLDQRTARNPRGGPFTTDHPSSLMSHLT